ncbi:MAG: tetratricopeptide repeat protein [Kiritimatiellaceae bacterium]|nr:tetratricopeptide repeat protein [Kiritimatiellaceae bacterium]
MFSRRISSVVFLILFMGQMLWAMNVDDVFQQADQLFMEKTRPEEALQLYQSIVEDGTDPSSVRLSRFKIGLLLDEQLMRYEEAVQAYQTFLANYPDDRLATVVERNKRTLDEIGAADALDEFATYRRLNEGYIRLMQNPEAERAQRKQAAIALYEYGLLHYDVPFRDQLLTSALSALGTERLFLKAKRIVLIMDQVIPDHRFIHDAYWKQVMLQVRRIYVVWTAKLYVGLIVLFIILKKGYRGAAAEMKKRRKLYAALLLIPSLYLSIWYWIASHHDIHAPTNGYVLLWMYVLFLLLLPISVAFYQSVPRNEVGWLKKTLFCGASGLLGISFWLIYGYYLDFLFVIGL